MLLLLRFVVVVSMLLVQCEGYEAEPKPCCLPYKFQAVITQLASFRASSKETSILHRDWERRLQVQDTVSYDVNGIGKLLSRAYMDYKTNISYYIRPEQGQCSSSKINSGMLEPCMPDDAQYLGESYLGYYDNKATFQTFSFRRTNLNRNIEMNVAVTSDRCVPVMETVRGEIDGAEVNVLVAFSNFTRDMDETAFDLPEICK